MDRIAALRMTSLRRPPDRDGDARRREVVAILTALEGHGDCCFTVQWLCDPRPGAPEGGCVEVSVLIGMPDYTDEAKAIEVVDDVLDLLNGPPELWRFEPVVDADEIGRLVTPLDAAYLAEIARREEQLPGDRISLAMGFGEKRAIEDVDLWTVWTLGPPTPDTDRLAAALLAQEAPVCVRMSLVPTVLEPAERATLEELVHDELPGQISSASFTAAYRTLESMLYLRPLFAAHCVVASPEPLSASLLSTIGHTLSEPTPHIGAPPPALAGGYAIHRDANRLDTVFRSLGRHPELPSIAPDGLRRLRGIFGVWEAANLFRLPVLDQDGTQGLVVNERPRLPGVLRDLPADGTRIGHVADLPGRTVAISADDRFRHAYVVGQTGTGKSTLLMSMALDDIGAGHGVCVIDPHGDLVEGIMARIPVDRHDDVVLIDPGDPTAVAGVNLIEAESEIQGNYLVSELSNLMYSLFDPQRQGIVGPRFETMMRQAILLLQSEERIKSSLLDVSTLFSDMAVRKYLTDGIHDDPLLAEYWQGEVAQNRSNEWGEVVSWFRSKFEVFRTSKLMRGVVGQADSTVSLVDVLGERRILLVNLAKGSLGEYNSALLGHVIVMKLWGSILERSRIPMADRLPFFIYVDEFQNITTDSLGTMLAEARKYGVGLTLANQFFDQLSERTRAALLGNVGTKLAFRLGPSDAAAFTEWLGNGVQADELARLPNYETVAALSPAGMPTAPVLLRTTAPIPVDVAAAEAIRTASRTKYATPVEEAEYRFLRRWATVPGSIASRMFPTKSEPDDSTGPEADTARPPTRAQRGSARSFLDEWLAERRNQPTIQRTWSWVDDWLEYRLADREPGPPALLRVTGHGAIADAVVADLSTRGRIEPNQIQEVMAPDSDGLLTLPRTLAGSVALGAWSYGYDAELLRDDWLAVGGLPGAVELESLGLPEIVLQRLAVRGVATVSQLRSFGVAKFEGLMLPDLYLDPLRRIVAKDFARPTSTSKKNGERANPLRWIPRADLRSLRQQCADIAAARTPDWTQSALDDARQPISEGIAAASLAAQLRRAHAEVRNRASDIAHLLGDPR